MSSPDPWLQLARAASKAQEAPAPMPASWARMVAMDAMSQASLGKPGLLAVLLAWLGKAKFWIFAIAVATATGFLAYGPSQRSLPPGNRFDGWSSQTVMQLKAWVPMECEEAGRIGLVLKSSAEEVRRAGSDNARIIEIVRSAQDQIRTVLTEEQKTAFEAAQKEIHPRWFRSKGNP